MHLGIDGEKKVAYMKFSWKDIWILIKKRKLTFDEKTLQFLTNDLFRLTIDLSELTGTNINKKNELSTKTRAK